MHGERDRREQKAEDTVRGLLEDLALPVEFNVEWLLDHFDRTRNDRR